MPGGHSPRRSGTSAAHLARHRPWAGSRSAGTNLPTQSSLRGESFLNKLALMGSRPGLTGEDACAPASSRRWAWAGPQNRPNPGAWKAPGSDAGRAPDPVGVKGDDRAGVFQAPALGGSAESIKSKKAKLQPRVIREDHPGWYRFGTGPIRPAPTRARTCRRGRTEADGRGGRYRSCQRMRYFGRWSTCPTGSR